MVHEEMWLKALFIGTNGDAIMGEMDASALTESIENGGISPTASIKMRIPQNMRRRMDALELETVFIKVFSLKEHEGSRRKSGRNA